MNKLNYQIYHEIAMGPASSTNSSLKSHIGWLQSLQRDIKVFGPDQINMIKGYLRHTGIHTKLIEVFEEMRQPLMISLCDESLVRTYKTALRDYHAYIGQRIVCLTNLDSTVQNDALFKINTPAGDMNLPEACFYIQDLLKDIELVLKYGIPEGFAILDSVIHDLIQVLPGYISKIEKDAEGQVQSLIQKLQALQMCISLYDFHQGNSLFSEINEELSLILGVDVACVKGRMSKLAALISKLRCGCC